MHNKLGANRSIEWHGVCPQSGSMRSKEEQLCIEKGVIILTGTASRNAAHHKKVFKSVFTADSQANSAFIVESSQMSSKEPEI